MDPNCSTRRMFERFLYHHLVKRNMHQTAEIFRNEANLELDPGASSSNAMDVPEEFLQDWWLLNCDFDFFRTWLQIKDTHVLEPTLGCNAVQEAGSSMNVEAAVNQLPYSFTPVKTFSIGSNSMPSHLTGKMPLYSVSSHQGELLTSTMRATDVARANAVEVEPSIPNTPKPQYTGFDKELDPVLENLINSFWLFGQDHSLLDNSAARERSRNTENLLKCEEENIGRNEFARSPPALRDDDNTSETSDLSSSFRINTADADASIAHQLESNEET